MAWCQRSTTKGGFFCHGLTMHEGKAADHSAMALHSHDMDLFVNRERPQCRFEYCLLLVQYPGSANDEVIATEAKVHAGIESPSWQPWVQVIPVDAS